MGGENGGRAGALRGRSVSAPRKSSAAARRRRERLEYRVARAMSALPPKTQVKLSRKPAVKVDGLTLDPEVQLSLAMMERQGLVALETLPVDQVREITRAQALLYGGPGVEVGSVRDLTIDGAEGPLRARHYTPSDAGGPHPLLIYYHGGGWVICDLDTHDALCRLLCKHAGVHVLAVDYRLAPEHRFPAAVDDARAALGWAYENADSLGADPGRIAVGGDSAGGNLATVVCQLAARDGGPAPVFQLLIYPATDAVEVSRSRELFAEGFFLTRSLMDWFADQYVGSQDVDLSDPRLSPLRADDLSGLAPAYVVTAGFDPLRDEGEAYAEALRAAGVPVAARRFAGEIHGFTNTVGVSRVGRDSVVEMAGAVRAMLSPAGAAVAHAAETH
jgi:acetyl esterase/lipase